MTEKMPDRSPWKSELYMTVTKEVPDADNVRLSDTFCLKCAKAYGKNYVVAFAQV